MALQIIWKANKQEEAECQNNNAKQSRIKLKTLSVYMIVKKAIYLSPVIITIIIIHYYYSSNNNNNNDSNHATCNQSIRLNQINK